ncbi:hypothetical protein [Marinicella litoralis]|uniref:Uncharacterized protein n=1 Tax=Marinicella litoralis TaxID=644220 RepID=A0A4R6XVR8_9GAMM|nr:hypothetical protein [Marinicella litoralis]TDR22304.1 hypothetical protein C8D91_0782 [Marinicella litoralis]
MNDYIDKIIGFYFDGGFDQMIIDGELSGEEIKRYGSLAVLFHHSFGDISDFTDEEKEDAYSLVESLYIFLEVELMFGESIGGKLIDEIGYEICSGYDFDADKYRNEIEKGVALIQSKGLELFKLIQ